MADGKFKRRAGAQDAPEPPKKNRPSAGGMLSGLIGKAKGAASDVAGVFSRSEEKKTPRTDLSELTDEAPSAPVRQPEAPPAEPPAAAPVPRTPSRFSRSSRTGGEAAEAEKQLPTRWDATHAPVNLNFSDRSAAAFSEDSFDDFDEDMPTPRYQGAMIGLPRNQIEDDEGDHHAFVPRIEISGEERRRTRFKAKNRRPMKMWQKSVLTAAGLICAFIAFIFLTVTIMLSGKMNRINVAGSGDINDLYAFKGKNGVVAEEELIKLSAFNDKFTVPEKLINENGHITTLLAVGLDSKGKADAMMLLSVDTETKKVRLVSLLPQTYVRLEKQIDGKDRGGTLRTVYAYGGAELLCGAIEYDFNITVDHYFVLSPTAYENMVNLLGGADITITDEKMLSWLTDNKFKKMPRFAATGKYILNGEEALMYSRAVTVDNEFERAGRQQSVIEKLSARAAEAGDLELVSVLYNSLSYVSTNCGTGKMLSLATNANDYGKYEVKSVTVPLPGSYKEAVVNGTYILAADLLVNAEDLRAFLYNNDMTYADGGVVQTATLPEVDEYLDNPPAASDSDLASDTDLGADPNDAEYAY